ncbi:MULTISPECIES: tetratricopeptide repeat protein [Flavobacterium]|uniref:Tetratricopeptide repeat protein n=1 Tax=Flavobacterium columnare TaxID=996 RepID=A0AA94F0N3_9FLAO|nr:MULTISPECIES: tetratricopeptide repeat protein [Flavobacterium]MCH4829263.1 tetratricopeptide repeat protein [Flavobacterium columnare]MCH4834039.1 tetratricopeptide repeat protein [Flavobacterium columnare]MCJ1808622.1 tetratricopeptide repeat protein [Flavobacterium covae]
MISKNYHLLLVLFLSICSLNAQDTMEDYAIMAKKYFKKQEWQKAKDIIDEGLKQDETDSNLRMLLGRYYYIKKDFQNARYHLVKSLQYDKTNFDAKQLLVNVEMNSKHYSSAICYINELLEVNPYWKQLWIKKIEIYRLQGNLTETTRMLKRLNQIYPEDATVQKDYIYNTQQEIARLKKEGKLNEAVTLAEELAKIDNQQVDIYVDIINSLLTAGDKEKALLYAEKGTQKFPENKIYITKKVAILSEMNRNAEALEFLKRKMSKKNDSQLQKSYDELIVESARIQSNNDPYTLYGKILEKNPKDEEALIYLLNNAISKGYYNDALDFISKAKKIKGDIKEILSKEYFVYKQLGNESKSNQILQKLHSKFPNDSDIRDDFKAFQYKTAKQLMLEGSYLEAIDLLRTVSNQRKQNDYYEPAKLGLFQCYLKTGLHDQALLIINEFLKEKPNDDARNLKKINALVASEDYTNAFDMYLQLIEKSSEPKKTIYANGFEEEALTFIKKAIEEQNIEEAYEVVKKILLVKPTSKLGLQYAISLAYQMEDHLAMLDAAKQATTIYPDNLPFKVKLAESYTAQKEYDKAIALTLPLLEKFPRNKSLVNVYTENARIKTKELVKKKQHNDALQLINSALYFDKNNKDLKFDKGVLLETKKVFDSAYYYQKQYEPSLMEFSDFKKHLEALKNKTFKNEIGIYHLRSRIQGSQEYSSISTIEYAHKENKNTYTFQLNYSGREEGTGIQPIVEWYHPFSDKFYVRLNVGYGTKYFSKIQTQISLYKAFGNDYEVELGIGFRQLPSQVNMIQGILGLSKNEQTIGWNIKAGIFSIDNTMFYNVSTDTRFYVFNEKKSCIQVVGAVGTVSDLQTLNFNLYNTWNAFNTMVGAGPKYMINSHFTVGFLGSWNTIKITENKYTNMYNLYFQTQISF